MGYYDDLHPGPRLEFDEDPHLDFGDDLFEDTPAGEDAPIDEVAPIGEPAPVVILSSQPEEPAPTVMPPPAPALNADPDPVVVAPSAPEPQVAPPLEPAVAVADAIPSTELPLKDNSVDTALFPGLPEEQNAAQKLAASLDPGLTPIQRSEEVLAAMGAGPMREILATLRREEDSYKSTHGGHGFGENQLPEIIEKLVAEPARTLSVVPSVLAKHVYEIYGGLYGLEAHLNNPWVSDIMINGHSEVFIEERGVMRQVHSPFDTAKEVNNFIERLVGRYGLTAPTTTEPIRDWSFQYDLPDGTDVSIRVNAVLGTQTADGEPILSMRKPTTIGDFDKLNTWARATEGQDDSPMTAQAVEFLRACVRSRATILVVGGTGSGKTSLLKALVNEFRPGLRILSIEESQELVLRRPNARGLVAHGTLKLAELVASSMRMRPDVILIGECRLPPEATQFLAAANTGHDGSITTTHASGTEAGLMRILNLISEDSSTKASLEFAGNQVLNGIDVIVFIEAQDEEQPNGDMMRRRRIMEIATMASFDTDSGSPRFGVKSVFGRYATDLIGVQRRLHIKAPMRCMGYQGLSDKFRDKMEHFGLAEASLRPLLEVPEGDKPKTDRGHKS
jgi:pilus assembly protein CpaF